MKSRESDPSFEGALEKLEQLLSRLESGETPLAELVERFEEGNRLLGLCTKRLRDAEQRIELLRSDRGELSFENFDPDKS